MNASTIRATHVGIKLLFCLLIGCMAAFVLAGCSSDTSSAGAGESSAALSSVSTSASVERASLASSDASASFSDTGLETMTSSDDPIIEVGSVKAIPLAGSDPITSLDLADVDLTVINFWSTTCPPCIREMPELAELETALPDNVQLLTYCLDAQSNRDTVAEILDEAGFTGITLIDATDGLLDLANSVEYTPTTYFISSDGYAIDVFVGAPTKNVQQVYLSLINDNLERLGKSAVELD